MWSLSVEEQFYLLWPTLLALMLGLLPERRHKQAVLGLGILSLVAAEALVHIWPRSAFFHLPTRGWELLAGAMLAMNFIPRTASKARAEILSAIGLLLMIAPIFLYDKETPFPGLAALAPVLGCALTIYSTENERTRVAALLSWKPVVFVGLISYSLYLWHWPIFAFATYELVRPLTSLEAFLCVLVAVTAAVISWRFIERPFRRGGKRPSEARSPARWLFIPTMGRVGQFAVALTALLIAAGSFFQESRGFSGGSHRRFAQFSRISQERNALLQRTAQIKRTNANSETNLGSSSCGETLTRSIICRSLQMYSGTERHI